MPTRIDRWPPCAKAVVYPAGCGVLGICQAALVSKLPLAIKSWHTGVTVAVGVCVAVRVGVGDSVPVGLTVTVGVTVGVYVSSGVGDSVAVADAVAVGVGVRVRVGEGTYTVTGATPEAEAMVVPCEVADTLL
jgi:hypothetical protein